jgi:hypothetical protein
MKITADQLNQVTAAVTANPDCHLYIKGSNKVKAKLNRRTLQSQLVKHAVAALEEITEGLGEYDLVFDPSQDVIVEVSGEEINLNPGYIDSDHHCPIDKQEYLNSRMADYFQ